MNPTWPAVDNVLDLVGNLWIGIVVLAAAAIPSWLAARNHTSIRDIKNQVVNGHTQQNLRDDVDRINASIEALSHDVRSLRTDLMAEEDRRRIQIQDVRQELDHRTGKRRNL